MFRLFVFIFCIVVSAHAEKKVELFAKAVDTNGTFVKADNDVVVLYDGLYVSAESATYDRESGIVELYGNVNALKGAEYYAIGDYLMLDTIEGIRQFRPFFFQDHAEDLWISSRSAKSIKEKYELNTGMVSSCNPQDPDWTLRFSSGIYDDEEQWMQLYNTKLYIGEMPIMYIPYIAYPTDKTRRTGLLKPTVGYSSEEGFIYKQPIFIAEDPQWDLELTPEIRTKRGEGMYSTLRFVDSPSSYGALTIGGFKEKSTYAQKFDLRNEKHFGIEFDYQNVDFLKNWFSWDVQGSSGIYADITHPSDVEYFNLKESDSLNYFTTSQITSKVNLFLNQSEDYYGAYFKYFTDLTKESDAQTIQNLPTLHYHHYLNTFFDDHLLYSVDYRGNNFYRETGKNAMQNEVSIPLDLQFSLLDEYLTLTLSENLYASQISFYGQHDATEVPGYSPGTYVRESQGVELNTNLVKAYDNFSHSVGLTAAYLRPGQEMRDGFYQDYEQVFKRNRANGTPCIAGPCEYDTIDDTLEQASLEFTQFIFTLDGFEKLYHRLRQPLIYEAGYEKYGDLENELRYNFTKEINYYNNTFYNYKRNVISKTQNTLAYNSEDIMLNLSHLYQDRLVNNLRTRTRYLTSGARYNYSKKWQYFANYAYDIEKSKTQSRTFGFLLNKRCWSFELRYVENIRPILNSLGNTSSISDKVLYFTITLRPLGGIELDYKASKDPDQNQ